VPLSCVAEAVWANFREATNAAVEAKVKSWLRQARDRDGGRKRQYSAAAANRIKQTCTASQPSDVDGDSDTEPGP